MKKLNYLLTLSAMMLLASCSVGVSTSSSESRPITTSSINESSESEEVSSEEIPAVTSEAPIVTSEEAVVSSEEPITTSEAPVVSSEETIISSEEPIATSETPIVTSEDPVATSKAPVVSSEEPVISSEEIVQTSEGPIVSSAEPLISSEEPISSEEASSEISSIEESSEEEDEPLPAATSIQDTTILHAWNWSLSNIKNELVNIKKAGYKTIQLSPLQPQKDMNRDGGWQNEWWKLYQPLGFSVAKSNQNCLGDASELKSLTAAAKEKGISIIVDVVTNHLAGGSKTSFNGNVSNFEPQIYNQGLLHTKEMSIDDNNTESIVRGQIGDYPDLKTESTVVQNRVISMLKEYIDCGIKGFRFDAAKHIETSFDGTFASTYWSNVLSSVNSYGEQILGEKPYIYGEILNTPGYQRNWNYYTSQMSVVDNIQGRDVLQAVQNKNPGNANKNVNTGSFEKTVLWAESHDTYANNERETTDISSDIVNRAYVIQASRKGSAALYYARPGNGKMGQIGSTDYKSALISAANKFHNAFFSGSESISTASNLFVNVRKAGKYAGAVIVNINSSSSANVTIGLPDGEYIDAVTNKSYTVKSGKVSLDLSKGAVILTNYDLDQDAGELSAAITPTKEVFADTTSVTVTGSGSSSYYQINNGNKISFSKSATFDVGDGLDDGDITIKVHTEKGNLSKDVTKTITKTKLASRNLIIKNVPSSDNLLIWSWKTGADGSWYDMEKSGSLRALNCPYSNFIITKHNSGITASNASWSTKIAQTSDLTLDGNIIDYGSIQ